MKIYLDQLLTSCTLMEKILILQQQANTSTSGIFSHWIFPRPMGQLHRSNANLMRQSMIKRSIKLLKSKMDTFGCISEQSDFAHGILAQF